MPDPVFRRCEASATVYWEVTPAGFSVSRLVVDCPLPLLETPQPLAMQLETLQGSAVTLAAEVRRFTSSYDNEESLIEALATVEALTSGWRP